jgi:uncharacterized protein (DUF427 family)
MYKAKWKDKVIAKAEEDKVLHIEGNVYFPPDTVNDEYLKDSDQHSTCPWKGKASYYDIEIDGETNEGAAWYYPEPKEGSAEVVSDNNNGKYDGDFSNFIAFWRGVEVEKE